MKRTLKSAVCLLLTLCMALSLGGVSALAEGELPTILGPVEVSTDSAENVTVTVGGDVEATLPSGSTEQVESGQITITPAAGETPATVEIAANIAAVGDYNNGVSAVSSTVTVEGGVSTEGNGSDGVAAYKSTVTVEGGVSTENASSNGVNAMSSAVTVGGGVSTEGGNSVGVYAEKGTVEVGGDVSTAGDYSEGVYANSSTVTVEGGVSTTGANSAAVGVYYNSAVTVEGGVSTEGDYSHGVNATNNSEVTVEGDVNTEGSGSDGVVVFNKSMVEVKGSVSTKGFVSHGVDATDSTVTVTGDVSTKDSYSHGVQTAKNSTVEVGGDVTGGEAGIQVVIGSDDTEGSTVVVEGTVSATKEGGQAIKLNVPDNATLDTVKEALPEIIVQSIDSDADYVVCTGASDNNNAAIAKAVQDSIKYIVDTESKKENGRTSTVTVDLVNYDTNEAADTYETVDGKILAVATATTKLKLGVDQTKGTLVGVAVTDANGAQTELEKNEDGDWVITVPAGGFLKITATVQAEVVQKRDPVRVEGKKLLIDLTETESVSLTAAKLRGYRDSGVDTVEILVKNGSFVVEMGDLLNALGSAENVAFTSHGETLDISADGVSLATLVLGAGT